MNAPPEGFSLPAQPVSSWMVPGRQAEPIMSVRNHRKLALAIALMMVVLGLVGAILFGRAKYEATASVRVLPTYDTRLSSGIDPSMIPNIEYRSFVQQQVFEIANLQTIVEALKLLGPEASLWQLPDESDQHAAERLLQFLKVEWVPDTFLITISLEGTEPRGLDTIVNAVAGAYLSRQERQELSGSDARVRLLEQQRTNLQQLVDTERMQLSQLAQDLGVSTFTGAASDPFNRKLADGNIALEREERVLIIEQARLAALRSQETRPSDADLNALAQKILLDDQNLAAQNAELGKQRESSFLQLQGLAPNHPGRPVLEREIADIDRETSLIAAKAMDQARSVLLGTRVAQAHDRIVEAQTRVDQVQRARDGLEQEVAALKASVATFGDKYNQALALNDLLESHIKALGQVDDRINLLRVESQSPGVASLELPAQLPDKAEGGKRKAIAAASILLAVLLAFAVPTIIDLADTRIKSSRELEKVLQMPILGSTPSDEKNSERETLRRIALGVMRERRRAGTRVFVVTAVGGMAGTSSLTLDLSKELSELGVSAVAVEANVLYPDPRYHKRLANGSAHPNGLLNGIAHGNGNTGKIFLAERNNPESCTHAITNAANLLPDRVSLCQRQSHHRLAMRCVQEVLELALASHDIVLIDTQPLLGSADTAMLIQNQAGVIVIVRADRDRIRDVKAAIQEVNKLSPPVVGVVMQRDRFDDIDALLQDGALDKNFRISASTDTAGQPAIRMISEDINNYSRS